MTELSEEADQQLAKFVHQWGLLAVLRALADITGNWSRDYDPSPATERYHHAEKTLLELADYLDRGSSAESIS